MTGRSCAPDGATIAATPGFQLPWAVRDGTFVYLHVQNSSFIEAACGS